MTTHGMKHTPEYATWSACKARCNNVTSKNYRDYGGRGITICARWRDSFEAFYADMGPRPAGMTLDRIDNNGHYTPENCRWATPQQQARNKRTSIKLTLNGVTRTVCEWAEVTGINAGALKARILRGWSDVDALTKPIDRTAGRITRDSLLTTHSRWK